MKVVDGIRLKYAQKVKLNRRRLIIIGLRENEPEYNKTYLHPTNRVQNRELSECNLLESIQETFYIFCRLVLQDFYAAFHLKRNEQNMSTAATALCLKQSHGLMCNHRAYVYLGGPVEGAVGVDVVVKDDDADHDPHAEQKRVLAAETTRIFSELTERGGAGVRHFTQ